MKDHPLAIEFQGATLMNEITYLSPNPVGLRPKYLISLTRLVWLLLIECLESEGEFGDPL